MAAAVAPPRRQSLLRSILPLLLDVVLVIISTALDIRDLNYKISWIGPYDSFSFTAVSFRTFDTKPAVFANNFTTLDAAVSTTDVLLPNTTRLSGWPSLLTNCEAFYPAGASLFIGGMGKNCVVFNQSTSSTIIPNLYMSASVRADSMAWAACKLLYRHRKPVVCHDHLVTGFLDRYGIQDVDVSRTMKMLPYSDGETEILNLLRVIAKSEPLTRVTCFEGFTYTGPTAYRTHIFGCGAPNALDSAFVGTHATVFADLHQDKAWLTVDIINLMGFKYIMRQNVKSVFAATLNTKTNAIELQPTTITNFSSSGGLYNLMIMIDTVLLIVNLWSSLEILRFMVFPAMAHAFRAEDAQVIDTDPTMRTLLKSYTTGFSNTLYRSRVVILALAASQLLSWVIVLPNSVIFTWSTGSRYAKIQAYLSCIRLWVLVLLLVNQVWDCIVLVHERAAYAIASRTYISTYEILAVGAAVSYYQRQAIFGVGNIKYALELQRTKDTTSFLKRLTLQNAYNEALDFQLNTPVNIVWVMYQPLFNIIGWSLFFVVVVLFIRFVGHNLVWPLLRRKFYPQASYALSGKVLAAANALDGSSDQAEELTRLLSGGYARLPLEVQLNNPIRARTLVRVSYDMETVRVNIVTQKLQRYIFPAYLLEHGILVDAHDQLHTRHGFFDFFQPQLHLADGESAAERTLVDGRTKVT